MTINIGYTNGAEKAPLAVDFDQNSSIVRRVDTNTVVTSQISVVKTFETRTVLRQQSNQILLGKIAMRSGKVNQHIENGIRTTDPDGLAGGCFGGITIGIVNGAIIDGNGNIIPVSGNTISLGGNNNCYGNKTLEYCQRFRPTSKTAIKVPTEQITTRRDYGNTGGPYTNSTSTENVVVYECK